MAQITHGLRSILSDPFFYSTFQALMGAHKTRQHFIANYVRPFAGMTVLDVGCGPADILAFMPQVDYWGYDISERYISKAQKRFGTQGKFHCKRLQTADIDELPSFDLVLALGLLHHLSDEEATGLLQLASKALKADGRLLTIDPCFADSQNSVARFLVRNDRGLNVRNRDGYEILAKSVFGRADVQVRHQSWIPYTHCFMECFN